MNIFDLHGSPPHSCGARCSASRSPSPPATGNSGAALGRAGFNPGRLKYHNDQRPAALIGDRGGGDAETSGVVTKPTKQGMIVQHCKDDSPTASGFPVPGAT